MRPETIIPLFDPRFRKGDGAEWISKTSKTLAAFFLRYRPTSQESNAMEGILKTPIMVMMILNGVLLL